MAQLPMVTGLAVFKSGWPLMLGSTYLRSVVKGEDTVVPVSGPLLIRTLRLIYSEFAIEK